MLKVLHICNGDKFTNQFINLINTELPFVNHKFFIAEMEVKYPIKNWSNVIFLKNFRSRWHGLVDLIKQMNTSSEIVIHGLFGKILYILFIQPWVLKKVHWVIWGGDLYIHLQPKNTLRKKIDEKIRAFVIKRIGYMQYWIKGDVELARKWYGAKGKFIECLMYPSNTFEKIELPAIDKSYITILVGNSADPTNNHIEVFEQLRALDDGKFHVICPLSYGSEVYADEVTRKGQLIFGSRFEPIREFMHLADYHRLLAGVDIAVFAHRRQQAMGTTISLLGLGKKVYMRDDVTPWFTFKEKGVIVHALKDLDLSPISIVEADSNMRIIKKEFSSACLVQQLKNIYK